GAEGVVDLTQVRVDVAIRIRIARVAWRAGRLDSHVRVFREREHLRQVGERCLILNSAGGTEMIDDQLQVRMAFSDLADDWHEIRREQGDRYHRTFGGRPQPVDGAVRPPGALMRLQQRETESEHTWLLLPGVDEASALGFVEGEMTEDRQAVRVLAGSVDGNLIAVGVPPWRVEESRVDVR